MEFELEAVPEVLLALTALKPLAAAREGRARTQSVKIVWHDSPDHTLLDRGLTLAERRGDWRLERVVPAADTWLPGQSPPVLEAADSLSALASSLPAPLAPLAAFEGKRSTSIHRFPIANVAPPPVPASPVPVAAGAAVAETQLFSETTPAERASFTRLTLEAERGVLRSVTAEQPVARIVLSGNDDAVRSAALMIAAALPVSVPRASLAARAIAMATNGVPAPRHRGAAVLPDADMSVADAMAHILGHLTDVILHYAPTAILPEGKSRSSPSSASEKAVLPTVDAGQMEAVHQMRVAVRRGLSAVSIFRDVFPAGTLDQVHAGLKTLGSRLAQTRDWDVFVSETAPMIAQTLPPDQRLDRLIGAASRRRRECRRVLVDYLTSPAFRMLMIELAWFAAAEFWRSGVVLPEDIVSPAGTEDPPDAAADEDRAKPLSVRVFAPRVLQQRWKKLISAGKRMQDLDIPSMHGVRLRAKRARYAAEMFAVSYENKAAHRFIQRLSILQQRLGVLNDGAVAAHLLEDLGGPSGRHGYAVGVVIGFTAARAGRIRPRIINAFAKFRRQPAYWT